MSVLRRFYLPEDYQPDATALLEGPEAHHLLHVLRLQPPARVLVFDGRGCSATAAIVETSKRQARLRILEIRFAPPPAAPLILGTAVPKGERFRWLVEKATELGVDRLVPLSTSRSVVEPREGKLEKLRQTVVAACKQSGRSRLLEIDRVTRWDSFVKEFAGRTALVAEPGDRSHPLDWARLAAARVIAIGPEGGLTADELETAHSAGGEFVNINANTLRTETAAIALCALVAAR